MSASKIVKRVAIEAGVACAIAASALGVFLYMDHSRFAESCPPDSLATLQEFMAWKGGAVQGEGRYLVNGKSYSVYLAPSGRWLASGPSAYLFDEHDQFVDWTADMGDIATVKHGFPLMSGAVVGFKKRKP